MKPLVICAVALGLAFSACSQDITSSKVPSVVANAVQSNFTATTKIDWEKRKNIYEAEFKLDNLIEATVEIDATGRILRHKKDIAEQQLPLSITQSIASQYKDYRIEDVELVEKNGAKFYQIELDGPSRKRDVKLVFEENATPSKSAYWD